MRNNAIYTDSAKPKQHSLTAAYKPLSASTHLMSYPLKHDHELVIIDTLYKKI